MDLGDFGVPAKRPEYPQSQGTMRTLAETMMHNLRNVFDHFHRLAIALLVAAMQMDEGQENALEYVGAIKATYVSGRRMGRHLSNPTCYTVEIDMTVYRRSIASPTTSLQVEH